MLSTLFLKSLSCASTLPRSEPIPYLPILIYEAGIFHKLSSHKIVYIKELSPHKSNSRYQHPQQELNV